MGQVPKKEVSSNVSMKYPDTDVPSLDIQAWIQNPHLRNWYNKLYVAEKSGIDAAPHGIYPFSFPVISRPIINLDGMSAGAEIWYDHSDVKYQPGYFWSEYLEGEHRSWDLFVYNGEIRLSFLSIGYKETLSKFKYWKSMKIQPSDKIIRYVSDYFSDYIGLLNIETIDDTPFEIHFRWCPDWVEWYFMYDTFYTVPLWSYVWNENEICAKKGLDYQVVTNTKTQFISPYRLGLILTPSLENKVLDNYKNYISL